MSEKDKQGLLKPTDGDGTPERDDETPETGAVVNAERPSTPPSVSSKGNAAIVIAGLMGTLALTTVDHRKADPPTPRPKDVRGPGSGGAGGASEKCDPDDLILDPSPKNLYGIDDKHVTEGTADDQRCGFEGPDKDGRVSLQGLQIIAEDGEYICWTTPLWVKGAALRIAGTAEGNDKRPGKMVLKDGSLELQVGIHIENTPAEDVPKEIAVEGEASLVITTTGRVSVARLPVDLTKPHAEQNMVLVVANKGIATILQEGRDEPIVLQECQSKKIPLNIERGGGCYVAEGGRSGGFSDDGKGTLLITAGALFLALRRRKTNIK